jgi:hypothetical protein
MSPEALRAAKPVAPAGLRERVRVIAAAAEEPVRRRPLPWRRLALGAVPAALAAAAVSGVVVGLTGVHHARPVAVSGTESRAAAPVAGGVKPRGELPTLKSSGVSPTPRPAGTLTIEVPDAKALSDGTTRAVEIARGVGGTVVRADVATSGGTGTATVVLMIPSARVTTAVGELGALGRIVGQHVVAPKAGPGTDAAVTLTLRTAARAAAAPESRAHRILRAEGRIGLWLGLVVGPLLVLALVAWLAWRGGRRLTERRLLGT